MRVGVSSELFIENLRVQLAMFCDQNDLTLDEGRDLAREAGDALMNCADYRATYLQEAS